MEPIVDAVTDLDNAKSIFEKLKQDLEYSAESREESERIKATIQMVADIEDFVKSLSDYIYRNGDKDRVLSTLITNTTILLGIWHILLQQRKYYPRVPEFLVFDLNALRDVLFRFPINEHVSQQTIIDTFSQRFLVTIDGMEDAEWLKLKSSANNLHTNRFLAKYFYGEIVSKYSENDKYYSRATKHYQDNSAKIVDGDHVLYTWSVHIWIDTLDAGKANTFMYEFSSTLLFLDGVSIEIENAGIGSYWQRWKIKIRGWFQKEQVKDIMGKGLEAAKSYALERHIEPVAKSKMEREMMEEQRKRMMTEAENREMIGLSLEKERQEVEALKLANLKTRLEIAQTISEKFAMGLVIDSDYKIMINDLLLVMKTGKAIEVGDLTLIDEHGRKGLMGEV